jgi:hypothetical protein
LWRGSVQITRTTPLRRITLQLRHITLTDAETFMVCSLTLFKHSLRSSTEASAKPNFSGDLTGWSRRPEIQLQPLNFALVSNDSYCWLIT